MIILRLASETLPENRPLPWIDRVEAGEVVPMPTEPPSVAKYEEPDEVNAVVEA